MKALSTATEHALISSACKDRPASGSSPQSASVKIFLVDAKPCYMIEVQCFRYHGQDIENFVEPLLQSMVVV